LRDEFVRAELCPGHLTVILKDEALVGMTIASDLSATLPNAGSLNALNAAQGLIAMRPLSTKAGSPYRFFFDFQFSPSTNLAALKSTYAADPYVWWASPVPNETPSPLCGPIIANDPLIDSLWHLTQPNDIDINAPEAWEWTMGDSNVVIAICSGGIGIDTSNNGWIDVRRDVARSVWTNPNEIPGNNSDDDGNGFTDDVHGWNVYHDNNDIEGRHPGCTGRQAGCFWEIAHGSFSAAYAIAQIDNTPKGPPSNWTTGGWVGVAPRCRFMGLTRGIGFHRRTPQDSLRYAPWSIIYAYENGATVFSYSFRYFSPEEREHLRQFVDSAYAHGMLVTNSFGNGGDPGFDFPPYGIACQFIKKDGTFHPGSPLDSRVQILLPGEFGGSSNASASIAGVIGLMKSIHPHLTGPQLRTLLLHPTSVTPVPGAPAGVGRTDALKAIRNATASPTLTSVSGNDGDHPLLKWDHNPMISLFPLVDQYIVQRKRHYLDESCYSDIATVSGLTTQFVDQQEIVGKLVGEHAPPTEYRVRARLNYSGNLIVSVPSNMLNIWTHSGSEGSGDGVGKIVSWNTLPKETRLYANYPNPFNPSTVIRFDIAGPGLVSLKVFDILGQEVSTVINGRLDAGIYERTFDASQLAGGVYFYRLEAGGFVATKKLVISK
jgi:hypothetical protein